MVAKVEKKETGLVEVLISLIITRVAPSLEVGFFAYLLSIPTVRTALKVAKGFGWSFMSTAAMQKLVRSAEAIQALRTAGVIAYDWGMGILDQHGLEENKEFSRICSLDLVRDLMCDFLKHREWLRSIFELVRQNDLDGREVTNEPNNLRALDGGLISLGLDNQTQLDFMVVGFTGIVRQVKDGKPAYKAFGLEEMKEGVKKALPRKYEWFCELAEKAMAQNELDDKEAKRLVKEAIKANQKATVKVPGLPREVRIIWLEGRSTKIAPITRWKGFDVCVVKRPNGHVQIFGGTIYERGPDQEVQKRWRIDLAQVARAWRIKEAAAAGKRLQEGEWTDTGNVYYVDGTPCPVYFGEFRTMVANGTQSSPDVAPTLLPVQEVFRQLRLNLDKCGLLVEVEGQYQPVSGPAN